MTNTTKEQMVDMLLGIARDELLDLIEAINHTFERAQKDQNDEYSEADLVDRSIRMFRSIRHLKEAVARLSE
jgi:hypothetical protein